MLKYDKAADGQWSPTAGLQIIFWEVHKKLANPYSFMGQQLQNKGDYTVC